MNLSNINWDIEHAGSWPAVVQAGIIFVFCLMLAGGWYYLDTADQLAQLEAAKTGERELRKTFETKQSKAANLEEYREQLIEIEKTFGDLLRQLPDKTQVPELLVDVSQTGLSSGLEIELFKPGAEVVKEFYAELPIEIRVNGNFTDFGAFVSGLASLPRIVTVHDIKISPNLSKENTGKKAAKLPLTMSALVKTYRYLDETTAAKKPVSPAQKEPAKK
jgi:type IV pilus assembly protein PilO